jgi:hypothetical protein
MLNKTERNQLLKQSKALRKTIEKLRIKYEKLRIKYFDPEEYGIPVHRYLYKEFERLTDCLLIFE